MAARGLPFLSVLYLACSSAGKALKQPENTPNADFCMAIRRSSAESLAVRKMQMRSSAQWQCQGRVDCRCMKAPEGVSPGCWYLLKPEIKQPAALPALSGRQCGAGQAVRCCVSVREIRMPAERTSEPCAVRPGTGSRRVTGSRRASRSGRSGCRSAHGRWSVRR